MPVKPAPRRPGRPRAEDAPVSVDAMLEAALGAFATHGYDGVSVNALSRDLGVSHNLLHQRFGSKDGLWHAAVDWGFGGMAEQIRGAIDPTVTDPLVQLEAIMRSFLRFSARRPELVGLMNLEGREATPRLAYIYERYVDPFMVIIGRVLEHLSAEGRVRPVSVRTVHFLIAHGAAAPFALGGLSDAIDPEHPLDADAAEAYIETVVQVLLGGLRPASA
jgi:TetR/AcrR family transcriptional regulator